MNLLHFFAKIQNILISKNNTEAVISAVIETMKNILDGNIQDVQKQISF
jgi:hypothetical protein